MNAAIGAALLVVGWVKILHHVKTFLFHDVALVTERLETVKTVVIAGAAHAYAAERNI